MAQVLQFRRRLDVFAPEVTAAMGDAYDEAVARLHGGESEFVDRQNGANRRKQSASSVRCSFVGIQKEDISAMITNGTIQLQNRCCA
jgi:hypothetical protein